MLLMPLLLLPPLIFIIADGDDSALMLIIDSDIFTPAVHRSPPNTFTPSPAACRRRHYHIAAYKDAQA